MNIVHKVDNQVDTFEEYLLLYMQTAANPLASGVQLVNNNIRNNMKPVID